MKHDVILFANYLITADVDDWNEVMSSHLCYLIEDAPEWIQFSNQG